MATAVFFHAHPDDEAIATGGTMLLLARAGHRVVVVCATDGARGRPVAPEGSGDDLAGIGDDPIARGDDLAAPEVSGADPAGDDLSGGADLAAVREAELRAAARILGARRVEMLGYADSGMDGDPSNEDPECFWQADVEEAAGRLAAVLAEEGADLLTCYDDQGTYGHPDHIQVHRVGVRAAELAGVGLVYESTVDRDHFAAAMPKMRAMMADLGLDDGMDDDEQAEIQAEIDAGSLGVDSASITHRVDVSAAAVEKRAAMAAHASQIPADSFFLQLPPDAFALAFGVEWYRQRDPEPGTSVGADLLASLPAAALADDSAAVRV